MTEKNEALVWLEGLKKKAKEIHSEEAVVVKNIREGFVDRAIVFIDVVGSTEFKVENTANPEKWILRVRQYSALIAEAIQGCKGNVVKYIGDEVMASFENIYDAQNLIGRISEIESNLKEATGFETRIKVAADFGQVYELYFEGHETKDPQGTPVDRCARIAKYGQQGEVFSSELFAQKTTKLKWVKVGSTELKGLGEQVIYQLGHNTINIEPRSEMPLRVVRAIKEDIEQLRIKCADYEKQNRIIEKQLKEAGEQPIQEAVIGNDEKETAWLGVEEKINILKKLIKSAPGNPGKYARFVFLHHTNKGGDSYDKFKGKEFDELIDSDHVVETTGGYFILNMEHIRNQKVIKTVQDVEKSLESYQYKYDKDPDDLFEWTMKNSEFWETYIGFAVI